MAGRVDRLRLRRRLAAHLAELGYSNVRAPRSKSAEPELVRVSPTRGHIAFGEVVAHDDLLRSDCHERLVQFSQRRTRRRSTILFFIGVCESDEADTLALLEKLGICNGTRGGHVHVVPFDLPHKPTAASPRTTKRRGRSTLRGMMGSSAEPDHSK